MRKLVTYFLRLYVSLAAATNVFAADSSKITDLIKYLRQNGVSESSKIGNNTFTGRNLYLTNLQTPNGDKSLEVIISAALMNDVEVFIVLRRETDKVTGIQSFLMYIDKPDIKTGSYGVLDHAIAGRFNSEDQILEAMPIDINRNPIPRNEFDQYAKQGHQMYVKNP